MAVTSEGARLTQVTALFSLCDTHARHANAVARAVLWVAKVKAPLVVFHTGEDGGVSIALALIFKAQILALVRVVAVV